MCALARWEGPGVLLDPTCPPKGGRHSDYDVIPGPCHRSLCGSALDTSGGKVEDLTSFDDAGRWWRARHVVLVGPWVFAMTVMPAATDFAHRAAS
jgi:hypothetical protein